ncbi:MAG: rod shape-determining protein MreC [Planctomycetales bacterium]
MSCASPRLILLLCLGGFSLSLVPAGQVQQWRGLVRDALLPGERVVQWGGDQLATAMHLSPNSGKEEGANDQAASRLEEARRRIRELEARLAALQDADSNPSFPTALPPRGETSSPLFVAELLEARVLGEELRGLWRNRKILGAGATSGIVESALVLAGDAPLVDQGQESRITAGDAVYAGRCVVGKITDVGRYSSVLQVVTDAGYSGRARLARRGAQGLSFGDEGTLVGSGEELCRLKHIRQPVNVGDEVYTGAADGILPEPMYYGTVVRAELEEGETEWLIEVRPAARLRQLDRVQILRLSLNAGRVLAD